MQKSLEMLPFMRYTVLKSFYNKERKRSMKNPVVTIETAKGGKILIELYPETAPNTVNNFLSLVGKGFYNGVIFHRVIPSFMPLSPCSLRYSIALANFTFSNL